MSEGAQRMLLHYRLVEQIGEGGMGVVWRATDTTLNRDVAIKMLPEVLSTDAERLQRFEREARLLASLNHAHIATIHGLHEAPAEGGKSLHFLVMELVEGEDLQQRLERGPMSVEETVEIGTQVALALEAAHAQGVVHRDLKPANVKLTASGEAKVLDFGLAKALAPETASGSGAAGPSMSPTITSAGTVAGMILGTAAYMSPEQARGGSVDRRADLWALGCLLYEMLTGKRCFEGDTVSDTLASVLKEQPDWDPLPERTPHGIRRLLRRCLTKDPRQRLPDAGAARLELDEALEAPFPEERQHAPDAAPPAPTTGSRLPWVVAAVAILAALGAWWLGGSSEPTAQRRPLELSVSIPPHILLNDDQESLLELSPDGRYLVFGGLDENSSSSSLFLRKLDEPGIIPLPDTANALNPFFSPDSRWVGFFADGKLKKIQVDGTTSLQICEVSGTPRGASWGGDDTIVFPAHFAGALVQVNGSGGEPRPLTELDAERRERTHRWPQMVPGKDVVLFTVATLDSPEFYDDARIDALRLSTGERKTVYEGASFARYVPTGHLVVAQGGFLFGVPFDIERLEATGPPVPVMENVMGGVTSGIVYASVAQNGLLAYVSGKPTSPRRTLTWLFRDGRSEPIPDTPVDVFIDPVPSPDGGRIAVGIVGDRSHDIWVFDLERQTRARLTFQGDNAAPVWTPDGTSIFFYSVRDGHGAVYRMAADGSDEEELIYAVSGHSTSPWDVSPDGRLLSIGEDGATKTDIIVKSLVDPEAEVVRFATGPTDDESGRFSPDGRWMAYVSDETGDYQVFVRPFPGPGGRWQISTRGGVDPQWSPDGREIHYRFNRDWWVVDVDPGDGRDQTFRTGVPRLVRNDLPRARLQGISGLSPDGRALLVPMPADGNEAPTEISVIVDWLAEFERKVSTAH